MRRRIALLLYGGAIALFGAFPAGWLGAAEPSVIGQTGLVHMPDARVDAEGTWRVGVSQTDPYFAVWSSVSMFSRLEFSGRYTTIDDVPGFADPALGDYRDKAFDAKLVAFEESRFFPAVAFGVQDYFGTQLFSARHITLSKRFGDVDVTLGYGRERIDGAFGGLRYTPSALSNWHFVVEHDANDYRRDHGANLSGADQREGGVTYGVGYRSGWWGAQVAYGSSEVTGNVYLAIPLMRDEFVPKVHEPAPYTALTPQSPSAEWGADRRHAAVLHRALHEQGFRDVRIGFADRTLALSLSHERISLVSRSVGRAARAALRLGPSDLARLEITYTENDQPLLTYRFNDPVVLARYYARRASGAQLRASTEVRFASVESARALRGVMLFEPEQEVYGEPAEGEAHAVASGGESSPLGGFGLLPFNVRIFFNDPGEPVRYDTFSVVTYGQRLARGLFLDGSVRFTLFENVSDIRQSSTSLLPRVRSDISEYRREGDRLRLNSLILSKYALLRERVYGRVSAGYYEEMFAGGGGQVLYLPAARDWAVDLAVDGLRQRAPGDAFGFRDYSVITGIASAHYRFPAAGVTTTARVGRFLAKDEGVRLEFKRRFRSGVEMGAWYSWTNEKDITSPGTPENPYRDKGLFVSIPLNSMLTRDTRERANLALADYTRDVGQLAASPGDLYGLVERPLMLDSAAHDPFTAFAR